MAVDQDDVWGAFFTSLMSAPPPPVISTTFSLNSRLPVVSQFHPGGGCYRNVAASPSSSSFFPRLELEREMRLGPSPAADTGTSGGTVERHKKRMIKNRESASRSRARKHAHVTQIETEVVELREANEQLRHSYDQLKATVEVSVPVRKTLQRMLSAPF